MAFKLATLALIALATQASAQADPNSPRKNQSSPEPTTPQTTAKYVQNDKGKVVGAIISRKGDDMIVRRENTNELSTVTLTANTKVESPSGFMNVDRKRQDMTLLIPGLFVKVRGRGGSRNNLVAERISFHKTALKVANQIAAGEVDLRAKVARDERAIRENRQGLANATERARDSLDALRERAITRMSDIDQYDVKYSAIVHFTPNGTELSSASKAALDSLAAMGMGMNGYLIEVTGFADATEPKNLALSDQRAQAVVAYLVASHNVPQRRIVNPTGLGAANPVASNDTPTGRADNRRVEVKVLVNRALNMPDTMPGKMPDTMPGKMPEKMPETMPRKP